MPKVLAASPQITGELKKWHDVILTFDGPLCSETGSINPFTDYRMNVTFSKGGRNFVVPGYFAADGNSANSGADAGNKWRVHFRPDETGTWNYIVSFRKGPLIAISTNEADGTSAGYFDRYAGSFSISKSDKSGPDLRAKGRLNYIGEPYLQYSETGEYYLKNGADSPESTLSNPDIDPIGTTPGYRSSFSAHGKHWHADDPVWGEGKLANRGKNLIGAINYLSSTGVNSMYLMTYTGHGDTKSVWPYISVDARKQFDCSKLDQWEIVLSHMEQKGLTAQIVLTETENENLWEALTWLEQHKSSDTPPRSFGPDLDPYRKLYYREIIARFGHHLAIIWNLGEEIGGSTSNDKGIYGKATTSEQRAGFALYIRQIDPYKSPIVAHTLPGAYDSIYRPFLNKDYFEGTSLQITLDQYGMSAANSLTRTWRNNSKNAGKPWAIFIDEVGGDSQPLQYSDPVKKKGRKDTAGVRPDSLDSNHNDPRKWSLWGNLMAGGSGVEWYFGWEFTSKGGGDGVVFDYSKWNNIWLQTSYAINFFRQNLPFTEMDGDNSLVSPNTQNLKSNSFAYAFAKRGSVYCAYFPPGYFASNLPKIDFEKNQGIYTVRWFDPRNGGSLKTGTLDTISANKQTMIGKPPSDFDKDWVVLIEKKDASNLPPKVSLALQVGTSSSFQAPASISLIATANDENGVSKVEFYNGSQKLMSDSSAPYTFTWSSVPAGTYQLTAVAYDTLGLFSTSSPLKVTVTDTNQTPVVHLTSPSNGSSFASSATISLIASATDDGSVARVDFYDNSTLLASDTAAPYSFTWTNASVGTHTIRAVATDNLGVSSTPSSVNITVTAANQAPQVSLTCPSSGASFSAPATINLAANASSDGGISKVEFYNGTTLLNTEKTAPYSFAWTNVLAGTYTLKAVAYDNNNLSTTSMPVTVEVAAASSNLNTDRDQISLNGTWDTGGQVPNFIGTNSSSVTYERQVAVPANWVGKRIALDFDAVNHIADIYVNGTKVRNHVGAWNPFSVDITSKVQPGSTFTLKVVAFSMKHSPIIDSSGKAVWPVGVSTISDKDTGIVDNVWLRAYGELYVGDAFIQTSVSNHLIIVDYTLVNTSASSKSISLKANVIPLGETTIVKTFSSPTLTLASGETKTIRLQSLWSNPKLWWPDHPFMYQLNTQVSEGGQLLDHEVRPFGFREVGIKGNQFQLNGIRINLWGDYAAFGNSVYFPSSSWTPSGWAATLDALKSLNIREIRLHEHPAPRFALDIADQKGMLIVCESAVEHLTSVTKSEYMKNAPIWLESWVKASRNHPSIFIWSAENGMGSSGNHVFTGSELLTLGNVIHDADPTRPVSYDGDRDVADKLITWHSNIGEPSGSIYSWANKVSSSKPTGASELISGLSYFSKDPAVLNAHKWWQGIWFRGMRYVGFTDVRPSVYSWASKEMTGQRASNLRNAYAPVALFDKEYDDLGIAPFTEGTLPSLDEGANVKRTLILYNDEFQDTFVTVTVQIKSGSTVYAVGTQNFDVKLGEHLDVPCSFQVPFVGGKNIDLILSTQKGGVQKFIETRTFKVSDLGKSGTSSSVVTLGGGTPAVNQPPSVNLTSPTSSNSFVAPATITLAATASDDHAVSKVEFYNGSTLLGSDTNSPYAFSWSNVAAGTYTVKAIAYDDKGLSTPSSLVRVTVKSNQAPKVALVSPVGSLTYDAPATILLSATASDDDGSIKNVKFYNGDTLLFTLTGAPYSQSVSNLTVGSYAFKAVATDDKGASSSSSVVNVTVAAPNQAPTVSMISPTSGNSFVAPATISMLATAADDHAVTKVEFYNGTTLLASVTSAPYTFSWTNVTDGTYTLKAVAYDSQSLHTSSNAVNVKVTPSNKAPIVSLTSPVAGQSFVAPATLTISASASDDQSVRMVSFYNGSTLLGSTKNPPYTFNWSNVAPGTYSLKAVAYDDQNLSGSSSVVNVSVLAPNQPPKINMISPTPSDSFVAPATITLAATASDDHSVAKVEFFNGSALLGRDTTEPFNFKWSNVGSGTYTIKAVAYDDQGLTSSCTLMITVNAPNQAPSVQIISPTDRETFTEPETIKIVANASDDSKVSKVEFYNGATLIGASTSAPFSCNWSNVTSGSYTIMATAYDNDGLSTKSNPITITVKKAVIPVIVDFSLINADSNEVISPLSDGSVINLATLPTRHLNIRANTDPVKIGSLEFNLLGAITRTQLERFLPYALYGDMGGTFDVGTYSLTAIPYSKDRKGGIAGPSRNLNFTVIDQALPKITNFTLINAVTNKSIKNIEDGALIDLESLPTENLNIQAQVNQIPVDYVVFALSGAESRNHTEQYPPFALFNDTKGNYWNWRPLVGSYTLKATPYSTVNGIHVQGPPLTIHFKFK